MDKELIIVRYGEIGIKSRVVRSRFEKRLIQNIKSALHCQIEVDQGRVYIYTDDYLTADKILRKTFGVVSFSPAVSTSTSEETIKEKLTKYGEDLIEAGLVSSQNTFAIRCRRVGKHSFTSQEMAAYCGSVIYNLTHSPVDLTKPDLEIFIEIRGDKTFIFHEKIAGPGGLPIGTQGRLVALLSTGIDSPVAVYMMMKRGCSITALNFNNHPYTSSDNEKIIKIGQKLREYSPGARFDLYSVDYGEFLDRCIKEAPPRMTCVLCKSGMYQVAEALAEQEKALGIIDGSSVGQVASQTLPNLMVTRYITKLPILSPLIGMDKVEIENLAKDIGTYELSIIPEESCSAAPRHPETHAELDTFMYAKKDLEDELRELTFNFKKIKL